MKKKIKETIIISLGGSLLVPDDINISFLKKFTKLLKSHLNTKRFFIVVGGGKICRLYQKALLEFKASERERDLIGIAISRLNAEIVKKAFSKVVYPKLLLNPFKKIKTSKSVIVAAGFKPGSSTDYVAVILALTYQIKTIINLTNIDYVYNKDPNKFTDAQPFKQMSWKDYRLIAAQKWKPGLSLPFDPQASKLAARSGLKVIIMNGKKPSNLKNFLNKKPFQGTTIQ